MENEAAEQELPVNPAQAHIRLAVWGAWSPIGGQLCGPRSCDAGGAVNSLLSQSTTVQGGRVPETMEIFFSQHSERSEVEGFS